jgi:hypothetical protein
MILIQDQINKLKKSERIERKVLGHKGSYLYLKEILYSQEFSSFYKKRNISSLYFDSRDLDFVRDNINGVSERIKIRIRFYNDENLFNLEYKFKKNFLGYKKVIRLKSKKLNSAIHESQKIIRKNFLINLYPSCLITYTREYFIKNKIRATLDKKIYYSIIYNHHKKNLFNSTNQKMIQMPYDILEYKYSEDKDAIFRESIFTIPSNFYARNMKSSKYVHAFMFT